MSIAIGITTTPKRSSVFYHCLSEWQKYLPENGLIHIHVDDGYRGVSYSKNETLKMCDYADHIFIVDDDIYPITENWHLPYIESGLNHACYTFNRQLIEAHNGYSEYVDPNGCMLYFKQTCLELAGGWNTGFKGYGYEHSELSSRIYNLGLTPARYIDIPNSEGLFDMVDCESTFTYEDKALIPANYVLYKQQFYSKEFKPFK